MGIFGDLFTSPREREAGNMYRSQIRSYDDILNQVGGMESSTANIATTGDVSNRFGLKRRTAADVSNVFNPARRNLATRLAQSRAAAGSRLSGSNATPEMTFAPIEEAYGTAFGNLESEAAQTGLNVERSDEQTIASLLSSILGRNDEYGFRKKGLQLSTLGGKGGAQQNYLGALSDASSFDDILSLAGGLAKIPTGPNGQNALTSVTKGIGSILGI